MCVTWCNNAFSGTIDYLTKPPMLRMGALPFQVVAVLMENLENVGRLHVISHWPKTKDQFRSMIQSVACFLIDWPPHIP